MHVGMRRCIIARGGLYYGIPALALMFLSACGDDNGGSAPTPTVNRAPAFTSATTKSVVENIQGVVYQATATDSDGDALTYSLTGGADSARFTITPTGDLSFVAPPNYDLPVDVDADNVYQVQVGVSDGKLTTTQAIAITVTNSKEGVAVRRVATGFVTPVAFTSVSATEVLVAEKNGAIYRLNPNTGVKSLLTQIPGLGARGVIAIAADSAYASNGTFYLMYTTAGGYLVVNRYLRNPAGTINPDGFGSLLALNAPNYAGGGWLGLDRDGVLLAATGDAGGSGDPDASAQTATSRLGKIIRFAPNPDPYAGASPQFFIPTVIAKGLHQPNGGSLLDSSILIADRGQDTAEEIDILPGGGDNRNYGWPFKEGTHTVRGTPPGDAIDPVLEYLHGTGPLNGAAIVGGGRGPNTITSLRDQYVFADGSGAVFAVTITSIRGGTTLGATAIERRDPDFAPDQGTIDHPVAVTTDASGVMYILDADGELFRVDGA